MTKKSSLAFISSCLFLLSVGPVEAGSKFQIQIPKSLQRKDGYDHIPAQFGFSPYGGSIQQKVYYAGGTLCDTALIDPTAGYPTRPNHNTPWEPPFILMIDLPAHAASSPSSCSVLHQVRNAQAAGASAVLLADTKCMCDRPDCRVDDEQMCHYSTPDMADHTRGLSSSTGDVIIPSFYLYKEDADRIKHQVMDNNQQVVVSMSFQVPAPDNRVEYDLWMEPLTSNIPMLSAFKEAAIALGEHTRFTPYMHLFDGNRAGCPPVHGESRCTNMCTNHGRYCLNDPDQSLTEGNTGAELVQESLRRICIWQHYGANDGIGVQWWEYMHYFIEMCESNPTREFANPACRSRAMYKAGVDEVIVDQCMRDSGGLDGDVPNLLLQASLRNQNQRAITTTPAFVVNNAPVRGHLDFNLAFRAICSGFPAGMEPKICDQCATCTATQHCVANGGVCSSGFSNVDLVYQTHHVSAITFWSTLCGISVLVLGLTTLYYRYTQEIVREDVKGILAQYMPLEPPDGAGSSRFNQRVNGAQISGRGSIQI